MSKEHLFLLKSTEYTGLRRTGVTSFRSRQWNKWTARVGELHAY